MVAVRRTVPEEDLPAVLEAASGRNPDGAATDRRLSGGSP